MSKEKTMSIKHKSAYYLIPVALVCIAALFIVKAHYNNKQQEQAKVYSQPTSEETKVVQENMQKQTEEHREEIIADTINKSNESKDVNDATKVVTTDNDMRDTTSNVTFDEDKQQETSAELPNNEVWDSETREIPRLSEVHLQRPHYTKVLDNGIVFDSRKSREVVLNAPTVTSTSKGDLKQTLKDLEKQLETNNNPVLRNQIDSLKRALNP
jgi:hypothetical protein